MVSFYGDSFTQGLYASTEAATWRNQMSQTLTTSHGATSVQKVAVYGSQMISPTVLTGIQADIAARDPDLVFLAFGINDVTGFYATPPTEEVFEAAARDVFDALAGRAVLIGGVAWCGWNQGSQIASYNRASAFNDILEALAIEYHYAFADLFDGTAGNESYMSEVGVPSVFGPGYEGDDFHYGDVGHAALYDLYSEALFGD